ncbi:MAG: integration host factor, actinobacterial type [Nitriliruptoraceae bacterium]
MTIPPSDAALRHAAVTAAVAARQRRAAARQALKQGEWDIHRLLKEVDGDLVLARMRMKDLATAFPGLGPARANALLVSLQIAPDRRVGTLGVRQRERLVAALSPR